MSTKATTYVISSDHKTNGDLAAYVATANVLLIQQRVAEILNNDIGTLPNKTLMEFGAHALAVSGITKKQEAKDEGGRFILNINMRGKTLRVEKEINGDGGETPALDDAALPEGFAELTNRLAATLDLDFSDAPEFS